LRAPKHSLVIKTLHKSCAQGQDPDSLVLR